MSKYADNRIYSIKTITGGLFALALVAGIIYGTYILFNEFIAPTIPYISKGISSGIKHITENLANNTNNTNLSNLTNNTNLSKNLTNNTNLSKNLTNNTNLSKNLTKPVSTS